MPKRRLKETELARTERAAQRIKADLEASQKRILDTALDSLRKARRRPQTDMQRKIAVRYHDKESSLKNLDFTAFLILYRWCKATDLEKLSCTPIPEDFAQQVNVAAKKAERIKAELENITRLLDVTVWRDILSLRQTNPAYSKQFHSEIFTLLHSETATSSAVPQVDIHNSPCSTIASDVSYTAQYIFDVQSPQSYQPNEQHVSSQTTPQGEVRLPSIDGLLHRSNQDPRHPTPAHTNGLATSFCQPPPLTTADCGMSGESTAYRPLHGSGAGLERPPATTLPSMVPLRYDASRQPRAVSSCGFRRPSSDLGDPGASTYSYGEKQDGQCDSTSDLMASIQPTEKRELGQRTPDEMLDNSNWDAPLFQPQDSYCTFAYGVPKQLLPSLFSRTSLACLMSLPMWGTSQIPFNVKAIEFPDCYYFVLDFGDQHPSCLEEEGRPIASTVFAGEAWGFIEKKQITQYWIKTPPSIAMEALERGKQSIHIQ